MLRNEKFRVDQRRNLPNLVVQNQPSSCKDVRKASDGTNSADESFETLYKPGSGVSDLTYTGGDPKI
jgi:hypothetical protein